MTTQEMLHIAMARSGEDLGCRPKDFLAEGPVLRPLRMGDGARKYLKPTWKPSGGLSGWQNSSSPCGMPSETPPRNHLALGDGEIDIQNRLALAARLHARCVLETKTVAALKKSVMWLEESRNA